MTSPLNPLEEAVKTALGKLIDPHTQKDFISSRSARNIRVDKARLSLEIELGYPSKNLAATIEKQVREALSPITGIEGLSICVSHKIIAHAPQKGLNPLPKIKNIIAVYSGKGGVGKSTTAANLALALSAEGAKVGLLDADIYGPSQPLMLNLTDQRPHSIDNRHMEPLAAYGIEVMSIGFLMDKDTPVIWRGPLAARALDQLLNETNWDDLDYLIVDMPPGTGDLQLSLAQKVPVTGAILITTPQEIALGDVRKGLKMFEQTGVTTLGLIENMSLYTCPHCGHTEHIFGQGGAEKMREEYGIALLGSLPLDIKIREQSDNGCPIVAAEPDAPAARLYRDIAIKLAVKIAALPKDMSLKIPVVTESPRPKP